MAHEAVGEDVLSGNVNELEIQAVIGFDGGILNGLKVHPDNVHLIYPLGNKVSILNWSTKKQDFLSGHTNKISTLDLSVSGKYVASGQINHIGFRAMVIIWDFEKRTLMAKHEVHKVRVESMMFSKDERYLISLGGRDCGSIVIWDVEEAQALSGTQASKGTQGEATCVVTCNQRGTCFVTGGDGHLMVWRIDVVVRNVYSVDVKLSKLRRVIYCMDLNERDETCYCGTSTGDVLKIRLNFHHDPDVDGTQKTPVMQNCLTRMSGKPMPEGQVDLYAQGVRSLLLLPSGQLLIGAGDGTLELVEQYTQPNVKHATSKKKKSFKLTQPSNPELRVLKTTNVKATITSIQITKKQEIIVGTVRSEVFSIDWKNFDPVLLITCHTYTIFDVVFPYKYTQVFATASKHDVRVWNTFTCEELLRIQVANFACSSVVFSHDGSKIITSWADGVIRAFTPITGRPIFAIPNAHNKGASALATTHHGRLLVSGGCEGQVRLWDITPYKQSLVVTLKEHKGPIAAIDVNSADDEAVSASTDGSCIIWDLLHHCRKQILLNNTLFTSVRYYPSGLQLLTAGTDRKIGYWEVLDGSLIREVEGSPSGAINCIDISTTIADSFVTGGNDQIVKLWLYQEGCATHVGVGHSAVVTAIRFSPDAQFIVSASGAGSIFIWKNPNYVEAKEATPRVETKKEAKKTAEAAKKEEHVEDLTTTRSSSRESGGGDFICCCCHCGKSVCNCQQEK